MSWHGLCGMSALRVCQQNRRLSSTALPSQPAYLVHESLLGSGISLTCSALPEFLFVYRVWSNPVFPEMLDITDVQCHDCLDCVWLWSLTTKFKISCVWKKKNPFIVPNSCSYVHMSALLQHGMLKTCIQSVYVGLKGKCIQCNVKVGN